MKTSVGTPCRAAAHIYLMNVLCATSHVSLRNHPRKTNEHTPASQPTDFSAMAEKNEMACVYAALVLHDDGIPITVSCAGAVGAS